MQSVGKPDVDIDRHAAGADSRDGFFTDRHGMGAQRGPEPFGERTTSNHRSKLGTRNCAACAQRKRHREVGQRAKWAVPAALVTYARATRAQLKKPAQLCIVPPEAQAVGKAADALPIVIDTASLRRLRRHDGSAINPIMVTTTGRKQACNGKRNWPRLPGRWHLPS